MHQATPYDRSDNLVGLLSKLTASDGSARVSVDDAKLLLAIGEAYTALAHVKLAELNTDAPAVSGELDGLAKRLLKGRRHRERLLGPTMFGEPAWDILLELYVLQSEGFSPAVSSIGYGVVKPTTMLRWIDKLCEQRLVRRVADDQDARRTKIELTDRAATGVRLSLQAIFESVSYSTND